MTRIPADTANGTTTAVLHDAGGRIRALVGRDGVPVAWRTFDGNGERIPAWLDEHAAGPVIVVLPSAAVTCRTCNLPDTDPERLAQALALQAEASLLPDIPPHRRAMAVLHGAGGETTRSGMILSWPPVEGDPGVPGLLAALEGRADEATFAPDVAALAALLDGDRPSDPLLWLDRRDGSVAMSISHPNGAAFRATRVADVGPSWPQPVTAALAETALSMGQTQAYTRSMVDAARTRLAATDDAATLLVPAEIVARVRDRAPDVPDDPRWWSDYGIALGALLATTDQLAPLTRMKQSAPEESPSRVRRLVHALTDPDTTIRFVAACVLIVLLAPLAVSGVRLALLKAKLPDLATYLKDAREAEVELAIYQELDKNAWPMTKLLADVACSTPEGIDVDQIRLRYGDGLTIGGRVKRDSKADLSAQEVVALMSDNLRRTRIFEEIHLKWGDPNRFGQYEFNISAKVARPYLRHEYPRELDYAQWTRAERLYGLTSRDEVEARLVETTPVEQPAEQPDEQTAEPQQAPPAPPDDADEEAVQRERARRDGLALGGRFGPETDNVRSRGVDRLPGHGELPPSHDIPDPMTAEQIQAMTLEEAQEAWAQVAQSLRRGIVDKDTRERLRGEFREIRDRIRELKGE